ncbi:Kinesin-7 [Giardia muris]|uniref:Kinesin-like protein n=1 Tax=Giardia muris TaxID=5742 RepID=A0A4Z1TAW0_GIAMU|nr:Kinesin-7 [Giardia muris]|eukprot:TNJ29669.1 Kinesin-7 [Giardia muris]
MTNSERIVVVVRVRPPKQGEETAPWEYRPQVLLLNDSQMSTLQFSYSAVYGPGSATQDIYDSHVNPFIARVLEGFNCTVFAYGQSSSGKSYTMFGDCFTGRLTPGLIPLAVENLFKQIKQSPARRFIVRLSYSELYNEDLKDLLQGTKVSIQVRETKDGFLITGAREIVVHSLDEVLQYIRFGNKKREVASTELNEVSSRSHAIFRLIVESVATSDITEEKLATIESFSSIDISQRCATFTLVDLAGSERLMKTQAKGDRLKEANNINLSLLTLGKVFEALVEKRGHVPYRDSRLTRILQPSLGGNAMTLMIACVTPSVEHLDETLNTLRYAQRASSVMNKVRPNEAITLKDQYNQLLQENKALREMVEYLKGELAHFERVRDCARTDETDQVSEPSLKCILTPLNPSVLVSSCSETCAASPVTKVDHGTSPMDSVLLKPVTESIALGSSVIPLTFSAIDSQAEVARSAQLLKSEFTTDLLQNLSSDFHLLSILLEKDIGVQTSLLNNSMASLKRSLSRSQKPIDISTEASQLQDTLLTSFKKGVEDGLDTVLSQTERVLDQVGENKELTAIIEAQQEEIRHLQTIHTEVTYKLEELLLEVATFYKLLQTSSISQVVERFLLVLEDLRATKLRGDDLKRKHEAFYLTIQEKYVSREEFEERENEISLLMSQNDNLKILVQTSEQTNQGLVNTLEALERATKEKDAEIIRLTEGTKHLKKSAETALLKLRDAAKEREQKLLRSSARQIAKLQKYRAMVEQFTRQHNLELPPAPTDEVTDADVERLIQEAIAGDTS